MMHDKTRALRKLDIDMAQAEFRARFAALLAKAPPHIMRTHAFFSVPANHPPWFDTGVDLSAGEQVTTFVVGRTVSLACAESLDSPSYAALVSHWRYRQRIPGHTVFAYLSCARGGTIVSRELFPR